MLKLATIVKFLIDKIIEWFYGPFKRYIPLETFRYGVTGGLNLVLDTVLYFVFYHYILDKKFIDLGFVVVSPHIAAFLIVFPITFTTGFLLAKYITFTASPIRGRVQLFRYGVTVCGSIILNYILLKGFVEYLYIWPTIAKVLTTGVVIIYSYMIQRYYTFKTAKLT